MKNPFLFSLLLSVFGFHFSQVHAQVTPYDCSVLWKKLQESNRYSARGAAKSEDYFFREYIHCLEANGDSASLRKWRHTVGLSAFSGGYAFKETRWYSAIIDSNFQETCRTTNLNAKFIGLGFYTEEQFGKLLLFDAYGRSIATPKYYDQINVVKSRQSGETIFIGETGLTVDVFNTEGKIIKSWEGISGTEVLSDHVLLLKSNLPATSDIDFGKNLYAIISSDLVELMPLSEGKLKSIGNSFVFVSSKNEALIFDHNGELIIRQPNVKYAERQEEFKLITPINGTWHQFNVEQGVFDSLIPHKVLNRFNYTLSVHPSNNKAVLIRNAKKESVFSEPIKELIPLDDHWFLVYLGATNWLWNPETHQKLKYPKTYAEAKALSVEAKTKQPTTEFPFFSQLVRYNDEQNRIQSDYLTIFESHAYSPTGEKKQVIRQDFRWSFTSAHVTLKNGWCYNYSTLDELVDSFRADGVYELFKNNLIVFQDCPEFIPLSYHLNGKRGVFYLGTNVHSEAKYDELTADKNSIYRFKVKLNDRFGVVDAKGKAIVPITYSSVFIHENRNILGAINGEQEGQKNALYLFNSELPTELDSTYYFVRSSKQHLVLKHPYLRPANEYTSASIYSNCVFQPFSGEVYDEVSQDVYFKLSATESGSLFFDAAFHPIVKGEVYEYCNLPCGFFVTGNTASSGIGYYSFQRQYFEPLDISFEMETKSAGQLLGRKGDDYFLFGLNCEKVKLPQGYKYKITNYDNLVYYASPVNESLWGLMKSDGTKLTEPLFEKVYDFEGEHGIVWSRMKRYYLDKMGKIVMF